MLRIDWESWLQAGFFNGVKTPDPHNWLNSKVSPFDYMAALSTVIPAAACAIAAQS